jgi:signal transduction histidine kinase
MQSYNNRREFKPLAAHHWQLEMNKIMTKYLSIGALIAIILNPLFAIVDYMTVADLWVQFLVIRIFVTAIHIAVYFNKNLMNEQPLKAGVIILATVVVQDAWFYSFTPQLTFTQVSLAYLADFVGAGMVLLWSPVIALAFLIGFVAVNAIFFSLNSTMILPDIMFEGGLLLLAGAAFSMAMVVFRYHSVKSMLISKMELIKSNEWMAVQNEIIEEKSAELQKSNNRLKEFAYIVSHDLKAPLRGIRNIAGWIREDCGATLNETGHMHLQLMDKQIQKMENLIKAVLEYSKSGVAKNSSEWINLDDLIRDVVEMVEIDANTRFTIRSKVPEMKGTKVVISQVLQNLLSNSVKHNKKMVKEVEVEVIEDGSQVRFMVSDNGPGIATTDHERVFDLFQNLRTNTDYESSGIGLAVARKLIEESGGKMWLDSEPGKGARFFFSVPKVA